ncbi:MAG: hypothetical protein Q9M23_01925, partial [Mariprofundaceae bacterium]|nr:hypothetical protein [Mariprofundaceae bacterium]
TSKQKGRLGSQRLLQIAVGKYPGLLETALREAGAINADETVTWTSPLESEGFREFQDSAAMSKLGALDSLKVQLKEFWPRRGPVWDATGITSEGRAVLLEAKAHIPEAASPASGASPKSMQLIEQSLKSARKFYSPRSSSCWSGTFYQYANRLAHLYFLRELNQIPCILIFLDFINAEEMDGPSSELEWKGATRLLHATLGLPAKLERHGVYHAYVDAKQLAVIA